jgi:hypothetical protein
MTTPSDPAHEQPQPLLPSAPPPSAGELRQVPRPKQVDTATMLWCAVAAIGFIANIIEIADGLESGGSFVISLIFEIAYVALVLVMRGGQNWARIVLTVLGGLGLLGDLLGVFGASIVASIGFAGLGAFVLILSLVEAAVIITAIVFSYHSLSNQYFRSF